MNQVVRLDYAYGVCPRCGSRDYLRYLIRQDGLFHKPHEIKCINCNSYFTVDAVSPQRYDVVKVVRCKDCAEWQKDWEPSSAPKGTHFCAIVGLETDPEWFCADGNRLGE